MIEKDKLRQLMENCRAEMGPAKFRQFMDDLAGKPRADIKGLRAGHDFPCALHPGPKGNCTEENCRCM